MNNKIKILNSDLKEIEKGSFARFSYRERMKLERTLFLLLIEITQMNIISFSQTTKVELLDIASQNGSSPNLIKLINKIFEFRIFIKAISSGNPYEKYDALSQIDSNRIGIFSHIQVRINKIESLINDLKIEKNKNAI